LNNYLTKLSILLLIIFSFLTADSLWKDTSQSVYSYKRDYKVGDTVTIVIDESTSAIQSGSTRSDKKNDNTFDFGFGLSSGGSSGGNEGSSSESNANLSLEAGGDSSFEGTGRTSRTSTVKTVITATVIDIQPNGNLFVVGQKQLKVNNENEQVEISGVIRIEDITPQNTISSSKIANAKVTVKGSGTVGEVQKPGFMKSIFGWLF